MGLKVRQRTLLMIIESGTDPLNHCNHCLRLQAGSFRITCENVMEVLRGNRDSLMAMLEVSKRNLPA